jgi:hypothetical protein
MARAGGAASAEAGAVNGATWAVAGEGGEAGIFLG